MYTKMEEPARGDDDQTRSRDETSGISGQDIHVARKESEIFEYSNEYPTMDL
jgi:hypothetical protein